MTKQEVLTYIAGYEAANALEIGELRSMTLEDKFEQTAALMETARYMGWAEALAAEDDAAREIWIRLKRAYSNGE